MTNEELSISDATLIAYLRLQGLDKDIAAADRIEQLAATNEHLEAALAAAAAYIDDLEGHEGAEGFSTSTADLCAVYQAALKGANYE